MECSVHIYRRPSPSVVSKKERKLVAGNQIYFVVHSSFNFFSEETFQREIMCGLLNAQEGDYLLWNIERTITKIYIPVLLDSCMGDKGTKDLLTKVRESY